MTMLHESAGAASQPQTPIPTTHYGGFRYDQRRNNAAVDYIRTTGREAVDAMPDPMGIVANEYTVAVGGVESVVSARTAMKYAGDVTVTHSLSEYQKRRASELNDYHEAQGHRQVNAIFQSADALMGLQAVREKPAAYRNIILAYPAGIARQDRLAKASVAVAMSSVRSRRAVRELTPENDYEAHLRLAGKPRTVADRVIAPSVALSYQAPLLHEIRTGEHAPGISMVLGIKDDMMRPDKVIKELQDPSDVDYILVTDTPHGINGRKDIMNETLRLLDMTEQARADREVGKPLPPLADRLHFYGNVPESKRAELLALAAEIDARSQGGELNDRNRV